MSIFKRIGKLFGGEEQAVPQPQHQTPYGAPPPPAGGGGGCGCGSAPPPQAFQGSPIPPPPAPVPAPPVAPVEDLKIEVRDPLEDAKTVSFTVNRKVSPVGTVLFENVGDADGWPLIQALFGVDGVFSIIVKENVVIVSRSTSAPWAPLIARAKEVITENIDLPPKIEEPVPETVWIRDELEVSQAAAAPPEAATQAPGRTEAPTPAETDLRSRIQEVLDREVNPNVAMHGGMISLLDVQGTRAFIHMGGGCQGCGMASVTLKQGVETSLRAQVPELTEILDTTDHAAGSNPFYAPSAK